MSKKILITGVGGFVGNHLLKFYDTAEIAILGLDRAEMGDEFTPRRCSYRFEQIDLTDRRRLEMLVDAFRPDWLIHLAAASSVAASWRDPAGCMVNNVTILLSVLDSVRHRAADCRVLLVGSSEVYDPAGEAPFSETSPLRPTNPYGVGRVAQEHLARIYVENYGLDMIQTRSFTHTGPGQNRSGHRNPHCAWDGCTRFSRRIRLYPP